MLRNWKSRFITVVLVAFVFVILVTIVAPGAIAWYFNPPVEVGINCTEAVRWGLGRLQLFQFVGLAVGFVLGIIVAATLSRGGRDDDDAPLTQKKI